MNPDFFPEVKDNVSFDVDAGQDWIVVVAQALPWSGFVVRSGGFFEATARPEFMRPALKRPNPTQLIHAFVVKPELSPEAKGDGSFDVEEGQGRIVLVVVAP